MSEQQVRREVEEVATTRSIKIYQPALNPIFEVMDADRFGSLHPGERLRIYWINFDILEFNVWRRFRYRPPYEPRDEDYRVLEDQNAVRETLRIFNKTFIRSNSSLVSEQARGAFKDNCPWG